MTQRNCFNFLIRTGKLMSIWSVVSAGKCTVPSAGTAASRLPFGVLMWTLAGPVDSPPAGESTNWSSVRVPCQLRCTVGFGPPASQPVW